ncbi:MAG: tripartite tricarboxylate transporter substrate binding protein [Comamonas sp.]|uniref:Bug family tripartite tricarboxylate transporter substrate binding protein n=1 Tax=Comamonas sp. TaxID=34028 RepID=UPI002FC5B332
MKRRNLMQAAAAAAVAILGAPAMAQGGWPERPIVWVSVSAPGGNSDVVSRVITQKLSERLKVPVLVENKPGASGGIASAFVAKAPPDGYTVLAGSIASHAIYPLIGKVAFDPLRDFVPIMVLGTNANVLVVPVTSPYKTVQDVLAAARATPGAVAYGSPGIGSTQHMSGELLQKLAGVKLTHVPNVRGSVITDVMAGHIPMTFDGPSLLPHVTGGRLRALAVTSRKRLPQLPDVPTMEEAGVAGFEVSSWQALYAPAGTPKAIVDKLNQEVAAVLTAPEVVARFQQMGLTTAPMTPAEFAAFQRAEIAKWSAVVRDSRMQPE